MEKETRVRYPESFKRKVIEEYLATGCTKTSLLIKYGIRFTGAIQTWIWQLGYHDAHASGTHRFACSIPIIVAGKDNDITNQAQQLQTRIKELERQLEDAQLRAEAYERIIEKAEKELKIPIRKKPNTK